MLFRLLSTLLLLTHVLAAPFPLHPLVRESTPGDIPGQYILQEDTTPSSLCPTNITHTSWKAFNNQSIVQHNTILVDSVRCASLNIEQGGKALILYSSADYDLQYQPVSAAVQPLPTPLYDLLTSDGSNIDAYYAAAKDREHFLFGYDNRQRVCASQTVFPAMTTTFLIRPFVRPVLIKNLRTPLDVGSVWMVVVPAYKNGTCLYHSQIPPFPEEDPLADASDQPNSYRPGDDAFPTLPHEEEDHLLPSAEPQPTFAGITLEDDLSDDPMYGHQPSLYPIFPSPDQSPDTIEPACFPASAKLTLRSGAIVRMDQLAIGHHVQVAPGRFSPVFAFTHADPRALSVFVRLHTAHGPSLAVSPGHFVYANGVAVAARHVHVADVLTLASGDTGIVSSIRIEVARGLFNPQTLEGDIVVDGVKATTYTTAVAPLVAEAALAPLRALFRAGVCALGVMNKGAPSWARGFLSTAAA